MKTLERVCLLAKALDERMLLMSIMRHRLTSEQMEWNVLCVFLMLKFL